MKTHSMLALLAAVSGLVAACGGGGDTATPTPTASTGRFVDSATQGIAYSCGGGATSLTDSNGTFTFQAGQSCTFKVGGITLGTVAGKPTVSPVDLVTGATSETNPVVTNITQFLMSLDSDNNPSNGIVIDPTVQTALASASLDFTLASGSGGAFETAAQSAVGSAISGRTLVSASTAQAHLGGTLVGLFSGSYSCTYTGTASGKVSATITAGVVQGDGTPTGSSTPTFTVNGTVSSSGGAAFDLSSGGTSIPGAYWNGTFLTSGSGSGQWANPSSQDSGGWTCSKA